MRYKDKIFEHVIYFFTSLQCIWKEHILSSKLMYTIVFNIRISYAYAQRRRMSMILFRFIKSICTQVCKCGACTAKSVPLSCVTAAHRNRGTTCPLISNFQLPTHGKWERQMLTIVQFMQPSERRSTWKRINLLNYLFMLCS